MATNMHGDIGPQGLLDHIESELIQHMDATPRDDWKGVPVTTPQLFQGDERHVVRWTHKEVGTTVIVDPQAQGGLDALRAMKVDPERFEYHAKRADARGHHVTAAKLRIEGAMYKAQLEKSAPRFHILNGIGQTIMDAEWTYNASEAQYERVPGSGRPGTKYVTNKEIARLGLTVREITDAPKPSSAPGLFHIMTPSGPRCGEDGRPLVFRYDRNRDSWVANHTHPYSHIVTHDFLQRQAGWVLVKVGEEFDPLPYQHPLAGQIAQQQAYAPKGVSFSGPGGVSGTRLQLKGFDEHGNERVEWVGDEPAPEPRSSMVADDFDQIRRRMEEIRAAEGRQAPA